MAREVAEDARLRDEQWGRGMMLALQSALRLWTGRVSEAVELGEEAWALLQVDRGPVRSHAGGQPAQLGRWWRRAGSPTPTAGWKRRRPAGQLHGAAASAPRSPPGWRRTPGTGRGPRGRRGMALERLHEQRDGLATTSPSPGARLCCNWARSTRPTSAARIALDSGRAIPMAPRGRAGGPGAGPHRRGVAARRASAYGVRARPTSTSCSPCGPGPGEYGDGRRGRRRWRPSTRPSLSLTAPVTW